MLDPFSNQCGILPSYDDPFASRKRWILSTTKLFCGQGPGISAHRHIIVLLYSITFSADILHYESYFYSVFFLLLLQKRGSPSGSYHLRDTVNLIESSTVRFSLHLRLGVQPSKCPSAQTREALKPRNQHHPSYSPETSASIQKRTRMPKSARLLKSSAPHIGA